MESKVHSLASNALFVAHYGVEFPFLMQFQTAKFQICNPYHLEEKIMNIP